MSNTGDIGVDYRVKKASSQEEMAIYECYCVCNIITLLVVKFKD